MNNKFSAFTLVEITIVMVVIAVIAVICLTSFYNKGGVDKKKNLSLSQGFYVSMDKAYLHVVNHYSKKRSINTLYKYKTTTTGGTSEDLIKYLVEFGDGQFYGSGNYSCSELKATGTAASYKTGNVKCATFPGHVVAGVYLNTSCNSTVAAREYLTINAQNDADTSTKSISGACGWIIYSFKDSTEGTLGKDVFVIPLGKSAFLMQ